MRLEGGTKVDDITGGDQHAGPRRPVLASHRDTRRQRDLCGATARDHAADDGSQVWLRAAILHARSEVDLDGDRTVDTL
jgi:hypothetical protein